MQEAALTDSGAEVQEWVTAFTEECRVVDVVVRATTAEMLGRALSGRPS